MSLTPRVHRNGEDDRELLRLDRRGAVVGDEVVVRERRAGGDDLRAADDQARVGLALDVDVDVAHLVDGLVAIDRRVDDRVVEEQAPLLGELVPAPGVLLVGVVEVGVRAQRAEEGRLVVGAAAHPAVAEAGPLGDRVAIGA